MIIFVCESDCVFDLTCQLISDRLAKFKIRTYTTRSIDWFKILCRAKSTIYFMVGWVYLRRYFRNTNDLVVKNAMDHIFCLKNQ